VLDEVGGYDPAMPGYEDWDLQLGALERGHPGHLVDRVTLEYRKHETSRLRGDRAEHRDRFAALRSKHAALYARAKELGGDSRLGPAGRLWYRTWWAWRPMPAALEGVEVAYYLVHSMGRGAGDGGFAARDSRAAENFGQAAYEAGVEQIVYLGGLSQGDSEHLRSRHETARVLERSGRQRSGSKDSGSVQKAGWRWMTYGRMITMEPLGIR